jgi:hypothetical protein
MKFRTFFTLLKISCAWCTLQAKTAVNIGHHCRSESAELITLGVVARQHQEH